MTKNRYSDFGIVENDSSPSFFGRQMNQLCHILSPSNVLYSDQVSNFYSTITGQQVFELRNIFSLEKDIGVNFSQSLDQMASYRIVNDIKQFIRDYGLIIGGGGITKEMNSRKGTKPDRYIILKIFWNEYYWFLFCYRSSI